MGCDIHIDIQVCERDKAGQVFHVMRTGSPWYSLNYQIQPWEGSPYKLRPDVPLIAPERFHGRNYALFGILAGVRQEDWPQIAPVRGLPDYDQRYAGINYDYFDPKLDKLETPQGYRYIGDHSFTWLTLEELEGYNWDAPLAGNMNGVVDLATYEKWKDDKEPPDNYCRGISGPDIRIYTPSEYEQIVQQGGKLAKQPHINFVWDETPRRATGDWPGEILPWLREIAEGRWLRLVIGFDS